MNCEQVLQGDIAGRYILNQLSVDEQEAFELHYFDCARCLEELEICRGLQVALNETTSVVHIEKFEKTVWWSWTRRLAIAVVLLALGLTLWSRRPLREPSPPVAIATPPHAAEAQAPARSDAQQPSAGKSIALTLGELAQFQPPRYVPSTLRGAEDDATAKFREAMNDYTRGKYASSIPALIAASQVDPKASNISFFLGICYLLTGDTDAAIAELRKTVALGDTPYLEEAHFYLAKALIRKRDLNGAKSELRDTIQLRGEVEPDAQRLLEQLQAVGKTRH
jgi:tetratricopeptide (TPR) repeat protein